ncbi:MAG: metal-dependent hydrolase [Candidatus Methanoperedens sp.]|nr:metal-dependent hydrolase [Candidatus Methanoperedens sp.]
MDLFSHALLPYFLGSLFKRNKKEVTAFVLGGIAPDFDVLIMWIQAVYPTFFLITHRGITHSLFFGFFTALAVLYLATNDKVKAHVRRFVDFEPVISRRAVVFAYAGVIIHLFLDYTTTRGVPLLYPFSTERYSAEVFFYTDIYLTILSLAIIIILYKVPLQGDNAVKFLAIFLAIFAVLGAVRMVEKSNAEAFFQEAGVKKAYPTANLFDWYVIGEDGERISIYGYDGFSGTSTLNKTVPRMNIISQGKDLYTALGAADGLPQVKMFKWRAYAIALNASYSSGAWSLEYYDPLQKETIRGVPSLLRRAAPDWGSIKVKVEGGRAIIE